jgi:hypothetical protein
MAQLNIGADDLEVRFTLAEKILGLVSDQRFPLSAITDAHAEPDGVRAVHGLRSPGLSLPGVRRIGTWRGRGVRTLVSVTRRQPALVVRLSGQRYDGLVIGCAKPQEYVAQLVARRG